MTALATTDDMTRFGYTAPANADALIARATTRIKLAAGHQQIEAGQSTGTLPVPECGIVRLWQFPATSVDSVTDDDGNALDADDYELVGNLLLLSPYISFRLRTVTVTYSHGWATIPDELVELICAVAIRLGGTRPDRDPAIQAQTVGDVSQTINPAALESASGLLPGEEMTVRRIFYRRG